MVHKRSRKARAWAITLGVLVLLVAAGFAVVSVLNKERTAQATLETYLNALANGDATTAASLLESEWVPAAGPDLLTDEVLANAEELISDVSVASVPDWPSPRLEGSFTLNGERYTQTFYMRGGEPEWGFLKTYQVKLPDSVRVTPSTTQNVVMELAGVPLKPATKEVRLFPAVYPVGLVDDTYVDVTSDVFVVTGEEAPDPVEVVPTPTLIDLVQEQVNAFFDECVQFATPDHVLPGCQDLRGAGEPGSWELLEYPTVEQSTVGEVVIMVATGGQAVLISDGTGYRYDRTFGFWVEVDLQEGEPHIRVRMG